MDVARVEQLVAPLVARHGCRVHDVIFGGRTLAVVIDVADPAPPAVPTEPASSADPAPAPGVGLDQLAALSRQISVLLDDDDPVPGSYTLEVTSPGLERALRRPEHFARAVGSTVTVSARTPEGAVRWRGRLVSADDDGIVVVAEDGDHRVEYGEITSARTVFEWGPTPARPVSARRPQKKKARP